MIFARTLIKKSFQYLFRKKLSQRLCSLSYFSTEQSQKEKHFFGFQEVSASEKRKQIQTVFSNVASKYDLMNDVMSCGVHRFWKDYFIHILSPTTNMQLLDVAGGTALTCIQGNAECLPFADNTFDAYSIAFGIRNVVHMDQALSEALRVLRPGGRFLCLEFSEVKSATLNRMYHWYSENVIPVLGELIAGDWKSYQYLIESIQKFPNQDDFSLMIEDIGFKIVTHENLFNGIAAIHSAYKL